VPLTNTFAEQIAKPVPPAHIETSGTPGPAPAADPLALGTIGSVPDPVKLCQNGDRLEVLIVFLLFGKSLRQIDSGHGLPAFSAVGLSMQSGRFFTPCSG
jgi:hypothetical protein